MLSHERKIKGLRPILHKLMPSSRFDHLTLSEKLTRSIRRLNPDFQDVFIMVQKDRRTDKDHEHWLNVKPYYEFGYYEWIGCPMLITCSLAAKVLLEICENPKLAELKIGIELIIIHDRGHFKFSKKLLTLCYPSGEEFCRSEYCSSEALVQLYAFNKVEDPIGAMAAALVIQHIVTPSVSLEEHMKIFLRNWKELVDDYWEERFKIVYHFPISKKATSEIIRKAANLEIALKRYLSRK
jgi:hypothetical protein